MKILAGFLAGAILGAGALYFWSMYESNAPSALSNQVSNITNDKSLPENQDNLEPGVFHPSTCSLKTDGAVYSNVERINIASSAAWGTPFYYVIGILRGETIVLPLLPEEINDDGTSVNLERAVNILGEDLTLALESVGDFDAALCTAKVNISLPKGD